MSENQPFRPPSIKPRRRWLRPLHVFLIAAAIFTVFAAFLAPRWLPLPSALDAHWLAYERSQRLLRARAGLELPGQPDLTRLPQRLAAAGLQQGAPIFVRIFKREFELELWMKRDGRFEHFATYPICRWSGHLGPKLQQGDHQAPEGFYSVDANALNPNSSYFRSFNLGYPNAFDAAQGRTGSLIMVHGGCASVGCFAMTDTQMAEIWQLVTAALNSGQKRFQVQVFPFRMTAERMADYAGNPHLPFWRTLKSGFDAFEATRLPPRVSQCKGVYGIEPAGLYPNGDGGIQNKCPSQLGKS